MKKLISISIMVSLLTSCNIKNSSESDNNDKTGNSTTYLSSTAHTSVTVPTLIKSTEATPAIITIPPSYLEVSNEIEAYFRMYYENNQNYKCNSVETTAERSVGGGNVIGYFDCDSLVKMISEAYGESQTSFTTYYFVNEHLIYLVDRLNYQWPGPRQEKYHEYFLIDGTLWQYNSNTGNLIESSDTDVITYFEQDKHDLLGDKPLSYVENNYIKSTENTSYAQNNNTKNEYLRKIYNGDVYDLYGDFFQVDFPNYYNYYHSHYFQQSSNVNALFQNSELCILRLANFDEKSYTGYEYYPIEDNCIYVVVYLQEFENQEVNFNQMKKNYWQEYYIIDEKVMKYDIEKQDLIEISDDSNVLTNYNLAQEEIKNKID